MKLRMVGCSHHSSSVEVRESLAFTADQKVDVLRVIPDHFPGTEAVLLSTCNRVEFYLAGIGHSDLPTHEEMISFIADRHELEADKVRDDFYGYSGEDVVRHLFLVASGLDSMVVGEAQILSQVKKAFSKALAEDTAGPVTHHVFESANHVAKRVATETAINRKRVSIASIAIADYAKQLFESFRDKKVLLIGAGPTGEETLRYLQDEKAREIVVINRSGVRAHELADRLGATADSWERLDELLVWADLVVSAMGAPEPIVHASQFRPIIQQRPDRLLFILDLAVPRDFDPEIGQFSNVYLYCIDDLQAVCDANRKAREKEWPKAEKIVTDEVERFLAEQNRRASGPTIQRLKQQANEVKNEELKRLVNKLGDVDEHTRDEITRSFDRLVNKLLHPPLQSLRDEAKRGSHHGLLNALRDLFQIGE